MNKATYLSNRAIVRIAPREASCEDSGEDVRDFLQGLLTNDVSGDLPVYAALLSAQGKAMFDFFVWEGEDGALLLDCETVCADELCKRLSMYRLRRQINIARSEDTIVNWQPEASTQLPIDPRLAEIGNRWLSTAHDKSAPVDAEYQAHRLSLGVPEGRAELGDILWLETNAVELNGVSFEKGCYIGQENTARMNWRQKVNRRLVVVALDASDEKRRKAAYSNLGLAVDHLRVADLDRAALPDWQAAGIAD